jgi:hypothetical protein
MNTKNLLAVVAILLCTAFGWFILGASIQLRTAQSSASLSGVVTGVWGPRMTQQHLTAYYMSPNSSNGRKLFQPAKSDVTVDLKYEPKKKGLLWYRTYDVNFHGDYVVENPTPISQLIYVNFQFPSPEASYNQFAFLINGKPVGTTESKMKDGMTEAITLDAGQSAKISVAYQTRGTDSWGYSLGESTRIRNFTLNMATDFDEIDFPVGTASPTQRAKTAAGWNLTWQYPDVISARPIGMDLPKLLNPGPIASRISYFAPVSLVFFFAVLLIMAVVWRVRLHPIHYFFLSAGSFAFQLLFAYLVDLIPLFAAFAISAGVSLVLVSGYIRLVTGGKFAVLAATAQFAYMVLFSYSFFFDGLTGLMITVGAIITLAILMLSTAKVDWGNRAEALR